MKNFGLNIKLLKRFSMRQSLCLVLQVRPFKIFITIVIITFCSWLRLIFNQ